MVVLSTLQEVENYPFRLGDVIITRARRFTLTHTGIKGFFELGHCCSVLTRPFDDKSPIRLAAQFGYQIAVFSHNKESSTREEGVLLSNLLFSLGDINRIRFDEIKARNEREFVHTLTCKLLERT